MYKVSELFDITHSMAGNYLSGFEYPWQALKGIKDLILTLGPQLGEAYTEAAPRFGCTKPQPWLPRLIWVLPALSVRAPRSVTVLSSGAAPWWEKTA